jgi:hypothetical protein
LKNWRDFWYEGRLIYCKDIDGCYELLPVDAWRDSPFAAIKKSRCLFVFSILALCLLLFKCEMSEPTPTSVPNGGFSFGLRDEEEGRLREGSRTRHNQVETILFAVEEAGVEEVEMALAPAFCILLLTCSGTCMWNFSISSCPARCTRMTFFR